LTVHQVPSRDPASADGEIHEAELTDFLREFLGTGAVRLRRHRRERLVSDAPDIFFVHHDRGVSVIHLAPREFPDAVSEQFDNLRLLHDAIPKPLNSVLLAPEASGRVAGRSFALTPYAKPFSTNRLLWRFQRSKLIPEVFSWLRGVTEHGSRQDEAAIAAAESALHSLAAADDLSDEIVAAARAGLDRIGRGSFKPTSVPMHGDLWTGNLLRSKQGAEDFSFKVIDWGGARVDGAPMFDLTQFAISSGLAPRHLGAEVHRHAALLDVPAQDTIIHFLIGIGFLSQSLNRFPRSRFVELCQKNHSYLKAALGDEAHQQSGAFGDRPRGATPQLPRPRVKEQNGTPAMPYRERFEVPSYRFSSFWRVAASSTFADRFSPDVDLIYHPSACYMSGWIEFELSNGDMVAESSELPRRRMLKQKLRRGGPIEIATPFIDFREDHFFNWSHQINSFLPVALLARERSKLDLQVLLPEGMSPHALEMYRRFGFETISTDAPVRGRQLIWRLSHPNIRTSFRHTMINGFMRAHDNDEKVFPTFPDLPRKLFVARKDTRRISNQAEVEAVLAGLGYTTIYMEQHSNEMQFALIRGASHIVGIHGAGLAPLQYYPLGREPLDFVEIQPPGCTSNFFQLIADQIGARYSAVRGRLKPEYIQPSYAGTPLTRFTSDDFEVDPFSVRVAIEINRRGGVIEDYPRNWFSD
jgi:hypothetical protein